MSHLKNTLGEFNGTILSDGYKAYESYAKSVNSATHALYWVHMRRGFEKAEQSEPQACAEAMAMIGLLYQHEEAIRTTGLTGKEKLDYRKEKSQPIVDQFFNWLHVQRKRIDLVPSDPFSKALIYAQSREQGVREFLGNPELPMDTNHLERSLRCIPMRKKNWMFCWTEIGAEDVGVIQSLLTTCKLHDVNPYDYLVDVLQRVGQHPASRVHELAPRLWKEHFAEDPLRSDLYRRNYNII